MSLGRKDGAEAGSAAPWKPQGEWPGLPGVGLLPASAMPAGGKPPHHMDYSAPLREGKEMMMNSDAGENPSRRRLGFLEEG